MELGITEAIDQALGGGYVFRQRPGESSAIPTTVVFLQITARIILRLNGIMKCGFFVYRSSNNYLYWYKENPATTTWTSGSNFVQHGHEIVQNTASYSRVNDTFVHKNTLFMVAGQGLFKYNASTNTFGSRLTNLGIGAGNQSIQSWYHDDDYYMYKLQFSDTQTPYWYRSNNLEQHGLLGWYGQPSSIEVRRL